MSTTISTASSLYLDSLEGNLNIPFKKGYYFANTFFPKKINLLNFCSEVLNIAQENEFYQNSAEYYFSLSIISWENKEYEKHRDSFFILIIFFHNKIPSIILDVLHNTFNFNLSERLHFLENDLEDHKEFFHAHPYFQLLFLFIIFGTKKRTGPYINSLIKIYDQIKDKNEKNNKSSKHDKILLYFYEYFHNLIKEKNNEILKLTSFISENIQTKKSQTLLFYLSYHQLNKNDKAAIEYANIFLDAENLAQTYSYQKSLYLNTINASIRQSQWEDYSQFLTLLKKHLGEKNSEFLEIKKAGEIQYEKEQQRLEHPLNPQKIKAIKLEDIPSKILIYLVTLIQSCGDDWGMSISEQRMKYTFPSSYLNKKIIKSLLINHYIKISIQDFNLIENDGLYSFNSFINNTRLHLNIHGVSDTKVISSQIIKEEIMRRFDLEDTIMAIWKEITVGYFYSSFEYYIDRVSDSWAHDFELNEATINRIENIITSAKRFSFTASSAIRSTIAFHELESTSKKHTQNVLLHNINKYINFIEEDSADYSKTRYIKAPILSIEKLIDEVFNLSPETLYNEIPALDFINIEYK